MSESPLNRLGLAVAISAGIGLLWAALAAAQTPSRGPDAARGALIAAQGVPKGAPACALCHAFNGSSDGSGAFPRLAGQSTPYLSGQLADYASGVRANAIMTPIAKALTSQEKADVAAYFAGVKGAFLPLADVDQALFKRGEQLAKVGDAAKGLQSCNNCHGPGGAGELPAIPYLAGQYAHYIAAQLRMWQRGLRKNSPEAMAGIARRLDDADIAAVAAFFQQVRRPEFASVASDK
jgi:cytochrome c553